MRTQFIEDVLVSDEVHYWVKETFLLMEALDLVDMMHGIELLHRMAQDRYDACLDCMRPENL